MKTYAKHLSRRVTPQSQPIPGRPQVQNAAGGYTFALDCWGRLERFLILGTEGGTYYAGEQKLTLENAQVVNVCAQEDAIRTVNTVVEISENGRAPKNDPAIFALAYLASHVDDLARKAALANLPRVCRTATHLFQFIANVKELRGWGRGLREAVAQWYNGKSLDKLAYQVTKYRNRAGFTHRDALRLSHPYTADPSRNTLYSWITRPDSVRFTDFFDLPQIIEGFNRIQRAEDESQAARLIEHFNLTLEHVPTPLLNSVKVWEALLPNLPPTALIRNLGKMTSIGLLKPLSSATALVCDTLTDTERLKAARVHPFSILLAQDTYSQGKGIKGSLTWQPVQQVTRALEDAFYAAFGAVEPTGKRHLLAIDVSGSMGWSFLANTRIDARKAAACMSLVTSQIEPQTHTVAFSTTLRTMDLGRRMQDAIRAMERMEMGGTDCALPMIYAQKHGLEVDAFVVYTDNETWAGNIHPCQALQQYRRASGINAKLIVVGFTGTQNTIADPDDAGMLDIVGFDAAGPQIMSEFVR